MKEDTSHSKPKKEVQLYERRGETSRYIDAEITEDGDLVIFGQDVGKTPREFWGDADYEFWVHVPAKYKDDVLLALLEKLYAGNRSAVDEFLDFMRSRGIPVEHVPARHKDDVLLALLEKLYAGNASAVDEFLDFMRSRGIPVEFDTWV